MRENDVDGGYAFVDSSLYDYRFHQGCKFHQFFPHRRPVVMVPLPQGEKCSAEPIVTQAKLYVDGTVPCLKYHVSRDVALERDIHENQRIGFLENFLEVRRLSGESSQGFYVFIVPLHLKNLGKEESKKKESKKSTKPKY